MTTEDNEITISYETLYDLLRREKSREDIQKLPQTLFRDLVSYINLKKAEIKKDATQLDLFTTTQKANLNKQIDNIVKILFDLYSRREKKIINLALNKARVGSEGVVDTDNLLPEEKKLFNELVHDLNRFRKGIIQNLLRGEMPHIEDACPVASADGFTFDHFVDGNSKKMVTASSDSNDKTNNDIKVNNDINKSSGSLKTNDKSSSEGTISDTDKPDDKKQTPNKKTNSSSTSELEKESLPNQSNKIQESASSARTIEVLFLESVPKFMGRELEVYGPYEKDDISMLPEDIAKLLIRKGRAKHTT